MMRCDSSTPDLMADPALRTIVAKAGGDPWRIAWYALLREREAVRKGREIVRLNRQLGRANRRRKALHRARKNALDLWRESRRRECETMDALIARALRNTSTPSGREGT